MTTTGPQHGTSGPQPDADEQRQYATTGEPQHQTSRPPQFVIEIWASPQLRNQDSSRPLSLSEALEAGRQPAARKDPEPHPEPEIEP